MSSTLEFVRCYLRAGVYIGAVVPAASAVLALIENTTPLFDQNSKRH